MRTPGVAVVDGGGQVLLETLHAGTPTVCGVPGSPPGPSTYGSVARLSLPMINENSWSGQRWRMKEAVRRVIGLGQVDLEATGRQPILALHGQTHHGQPVEVRAQRTVLLERVLRCDHQPHLIQMPQCFSMCSAMATWPLCGGSKVPKRQPIFHASKESLDTRSYASAQACSKVSFTTMTSNCGVRRSFRVRPYPRVLARLSGDSVPRASKRCSNTSTMAG
jgi:hypothetical protein